MLDAMHVHVKAKANLGICTNIVDLSQMFITKNCVLLNHFGVNDWCARGENSCQKVHIVFTCCLTALVHVYIYGIK